MNDFQNQIANITSEIPTISPFGNANWTWKNAEVCTDSQKLDLKI